MASRCCACSQGPQPDNCLTPPLNSAMIGELEWFYGLDENLCWKFMQLADLLGFVDCAGNPITPDTPLVTCAGFPTRLCQALAAVADGAVVVPGVTELIGADCLTHTIPTLCAQIQGLASGPAITLGVTEVVTENCQLAVVPETPITVVDTLTVDLTASGSFNHTIQADVKISNVVDNCLVVQVDGLYVACPDDPVDVCETIQDFPVGAPGIPGTTQFVGADCLLHALPDATADTNITAIDGDCIDLTVTEVTPNNFTIEADVIVSPNAGNALSCVGNGLFVQDVEITAGEASCVDITVTGCCGDWEISGDVVISPDSGNILECRDNGLYAQNVGFNVDDTDCIGLILAGDTLTAVPILAPGPNALSCTEDGLLVTPGADFDLCEAINDLATGNMAGPGTLLVGSDCLLHAAPVVVPVDTPSINQTVTYVTNVGYQISSVVTLDTTHPGYPAACNGLVSDAGGLSAPPDITGAFESDEDQPGGTFAVNAGVTEPGNVFAGQSIVLNNPSSCRSMLVSLFGSGDARIIWDYSDPLPTTGYDIRAFILMEASKDGGATWTRYGALANAHGHAAPASLNNAMLTSVHEQQIMSAFDGIIIPPGGSVNFQTRFTAIVTDNDNGPAIQFEVQFLQIRAIGHSI